MTIATIDQVRRECIRIGSMLSKNSSAEPLRKRVSEIQIRAEKTGPTEIEAILEMGRQLEALEVPDVAKRPEYRTDIE